MWFGFGLITLIVALVLGIRSRTGARWKGSAFQLETPLGPYAGRSRYPYLFQEVRQDGKRGKVRIGVDAPANFHFVVREERPRDRLFKWLGISVEMQLDDDQFDRRVYLESDARGIAWFLSDSAELRTVVLDILRYAGKYHRRGVTLRCAHGRLWVEFFPKKERYGGVPTVAASLVPRLHQLSEGMRNSQLTAAQLHDPFIWRAALMLSISTASVVLGIYGLMRSTGRTDILDSVSLFIASAGVGAIFTAGFVMAVLAVLGRSSRTHLVLVEGVLLGGAGFVLSVFALAREANIEFDFERPRMHELHSIRAEHYIKSGRRGKKHRYYLHTADWRPQHAGEQMKLEITRDDYQALEGQNEALIFVRPGALGYEWIERVMPVGQPE